jgi:hypothetical protein
MMVKYMVKYGASVGFLPRPHVMAPTLAVREDK